jgi:hypothetical protein
MNTTATIVLIAAIAPASEIGEADAARIKYSRQRFVCLDVGEAHVFKLKDGKERRIVLKSVEERADTVLDLQRRADVLVEVDGAPLALVCEPYTMPAEVAGLRILADTTSRWMDLPKRVQLSLWDAADPIVDTDLFVFPLAGYDLFSQGTQCYNEPVHLGHRDGDPKGQRFYHNYGFDMAGFEGRDEVLACADGKTTIVDRDAGTLIFEDDRGIVFEYGHMEKILPEIAEGVAVKRGAKLGLVGKRGASGNFSHLHVGLYLSRADLGVDRPCRNLNLYPWIVEAYRKASGRTLFAVARPHQAIRVGETVRLDGTKSLAFGSRIKTFRWEFHDGTSVEKPMAEKVYDRPGTYMATLWVEDERGSRDVDFCKVKVYSRDKLEPVMPIIFLTCSPTRDVRAGMPVFFRGWPHGEEDIGPIRIDFGDGTAVEKYEPYSEVRHAFERPGLHFVTASASPGGRSVTGKVKVLVTDGARSGERSAAGGIRDRLWIWGHPAGEYNESYLAGHPKKSAIEPVDAAAYMGIPNMIFVRSRGKPEPPFGAYYEPFKGLRRVYWSLVAAGGGTSAEERERAYELAEANGNIAGFILDDFFHESASDEGPAPWLAENLVSFPVTVTFTPPAPVSCDAVELVQSAWRTGDYRSKDFAVEVSADGKDFTTIERGTLPNEPRAAVRVKLPGGRLAALRIRILGTHDTEIARSCGLGAVRFFRGGDELIAKEWKVAASSTYPGFDAATLVGRLLPFRAALTPEELRELGRRKVRGAKLPIMAVVYTGQISPRAKGHLDEVDEVCLWTWRPEDLKDLEANLTRLEALVPGKPIYLGCYTFDFDASRPLPVEPMEKQTRLGHRWLEEGRIQGMIFLATANVDVGLEAVEWTRRWIGTLGK